MPEEYYVYMTCSNNRNALYIGYTHDLAKRIYAHRHHLVPGHTRNYNCVNLVYYEYGGSKEGAMMREAQLKKWSRAKKNKLVESMNPEWKDLSEELGILV